MFTGIIKDVGIIREVTTSKGGDKRFTVQTKLNLDPHPLGASICCHGVCLTIVSKDKDVFAVDVSNETLAVTSLKTLGEGDAINLEPSLRVGDELGGHIVSGHADGLAEVVDRNQDGDSVRFVFKIPPQYAPFIASKGSIAINGVSLTVNEVENESFGVNIIPHTLTHTTFSDLRPGDKVNFEVDMLARYVMRAVKTG